MHLTSIKPRYFCLLTIALTFHSKTHAPLKDKISIKFCLIFTIYFNSTDDNFASRVSSIGCLLHYTDFPCSTILKNEREVCNITLSVPSDFESLPGVLFARRCAKDVKTCAVFVLLCIGFDSINLLQEILGTYVLLPPICCAILVLCFDRIHASYVLFVLECISLSCSLFKAFTLY